MPTIQAAEGPNRTQAQLTDILRHERRVELAFEGLRLAPNRSLEEPEASATSQVLSGLQLREQFNDSAKPVDDSLQVINHLLFLEQADVISQRLVSILNDWSESPESELPTEAQLNVQSMAQLARQLVLMLSAQAQFQGFAQMRVQVDLPVAKL